MRTSRKVLRFGLLSDLVRRYADACVVLVLSVLTIVAEWDLFREEITLGMDAATQYYPFYYFLGETLSSGELPGWNPYQFSGTPFAADPLTGWSYLPVMLLFTLLPLTAATKGFMFLHLLLAGLFTYALARALGISIPGAALAAIAYEYGGFLYLVNPCCFGYIGVMVWLPLAILGAELAVRSTRWPSRGLWWGVSGLGISQMLGTWLGQGSYYGLLALGGYVAYRTLLSPPDNLRGLRAQVIALVLHGGAVLAFGFALAAAGLLPRLEFNALSNLAGGYPEESRVQGGWSLPEDWVLLLQPGLWYVGLIVAALALVAPFVARERFAVPYFGALALFTLVLTSPIPTPLHLLLYLLPRFERLHPHTPDRIILIFYLGAALLAGAALTALAERAPRKPSLLVLPSLVALLLAAVMTFFHPRPGGWVILSPLSLGGFSIPVISLLFLVSALTLLVAYTLLPARSPTWRGLAFVLLAFVVLADLMTANRATVIEQANATGGSVVGDRMTETEIGDYYRPSGAARFLQLQGEEPFRYLGFDPGLGEDSYVSSPARFMDPSIQSLEPNGRSMVMGLQNVQGYNPTHIARYDEYMNTLNGSGQNYHFIDVYEGGLDSPLLDLLNTRYIIVPVEPSQEDPASVARFEQFERTHPTVYEDDRSRVLQNPEALPRAWIVHSTRQAEPEEALRLLDSGEVDPEVTALVEEEPPEMSQPDDASADRASVTEYEPNKIQLQSSTDAPGLLVLSEVYYPAWKAYVDGQPAPVYIADQLLRSVPVPAGEHTVELRYESWALWAGIGISLVAYAALIVLSLTAALSRKSVDGRGPTTG